MKFILGIQTAEFPNSFSIINESEKLICDHKFEKKEKTIEQLKGVLTKLLSENDISIEDISMVSVCLGPGSYTGIRGGLVFAKGFCQFTGIPLVGVSAPDTLFRHAKERIKGNDSITLFDAKNRRVYYQLNNRNDIRVSSLDKVLKNIKRKTILIGSGVLANRGIIKSELKINVIFLDDEYSILSSTSVAKYGIHLYKLNQKKYDQKYLYSIKPLYILPVNITKSKK